MSTPRLLITSGIIWTPHDWVNKFYSFCMAAVIDITVIWVIFVVKDFQKIIFHMINFHTVQMCMNISTYEHLVIATCEWVVIS